MESGGGNIFRGILSDKFQKEFGSRGSRWKGSSVVKFVMREMFGGALLLVGGVPVTYEVSCGAISEKNAIVGIRVKSGQAFLSFLGNDF